MCHFEHGGDYSVDAYFHHTASSNLLINTVVATVVHQAQVPRDFICPRVEHRGDARRPHAARHAHSTLPRKIAAHAQHLGWDATVQSPQSVPAPRLTYVASSKLAFCLSSELMYGVNQILGLHNQAGLAVGPCS